MANEYSTLLDIAARNFGRDNVELIEDNVTYAPEVNLFPADTRAGTTFKAYIRSDLPPADFRDANEGVDIGKSDYRTVEAIMKYLDSQLQPDISVASADDRGSGRFLDDELMGAFKSSVIKLGKICWYGNDPTLGSTKAPPGALQVINSARTVDATGTTANAKASLWLVNLDPRYSGLLLNQDQPALRMGPWKLQTIVRDSKSLTCWVNSVEGYAGFRFLNPLAIGRIKNLTAQTGKGLTESLGYELLSKFPDGEQPTHAFTTRAQRELLRKSQITDLITSPPVPKTFCGLPLFATDSLVNTES